MNDYFALRVVKWIKSAQVPYMITGAVVLPQYTKFPRATGDVDVGIFVKGLTENEIKRLVENGRGYGFIIDERIVRSLMISGRSYKINPEGTRLSIHLMFFTPDIYTDLMFKNRRNMNFYGEPTYIISKKDLVVNKIYAMHIIKSGYEYEKQKNDTRLLIKTGVDREYVIKWCVYLHCDDELKNVSL